MIARTWLLLGTIAVLGLIAQDLRPGLSLPSWLQDPTTIQALAAVTAIIVAIGAVWVTLYTAAQDRRVRADDRRIRGQTLAILLLPQLMEVKAKAMGKKNFLNNVAMQLIQTGQFDDLKQGILDLPDLLVERVDDLHFLGMQAAAPMIQLVSIGIQYDKMLTALIGDLGTRGYAASDPEAAVGYLRSYIDQLETLVDESLEGIAKIHDEIIPPDR